MDSFVLNTLTSLNVGEIVIERFRDEEIDESSFRSLTESMLTELVPKISKRSKIWQCIVDLKTPQLSNSDVIKISNEDNFDLLSNGNFREIMLVGKNDDAEILCSNAADVSDVSSEHTILINLPEKSSDTNINIHHDQTYNLLNILNKYQEGQIILKHYGFSGTLQPSMRNKLAHLIVTHLLANNSDQKISASELKRFSIEIVNLFPTETEQTYFISYKKELKHFTPNRGKLWDKYCNLRKYIRSVAPPSDKTVQVALTPIINDKDYEEHLLWLKNNIGPWEEIIEKWNDTFQIRYKNLINCDQKVNYFQEYPALRSPNGFNLIEMDFHNLYPDKDMLLFLKFETFKKQIKKYISHSKKDLCKHIPTLLFEVEHPTKPGNDDVAGLKIFIELFQPLNVSCKRTHGPGNTQKNYWRPSKSEIKQGFICFTNDISRLKDIDKEKSEKALRLGQTIQPYMIFVGEHCSSLDSVDVHSFYVAINHNFLKLETALKAVDVCFKTFFSLDMNYPLESDQIWQFIQKYFYSVSTKYDKNYQMVNSTIKELNSA